MAGHSQSSPAESSSSDDNDPSALTLAQFFIGPALTALPEPSQEDNRTLNRGFKSINNIVRQFCKKMVSLLLDNTKGQNGTITSNSTPSMTLFSSMKTLRLQCCGHWQGLQKFSAEMTR